LSTLNQRIKLKYFKLSYWWKRPKLAFSPQRKGIVLRLRVCTPRKPNSARRPVVKGFLSSDKKVLAHIPGKGHTLRRHSKTLICGTGARDVPIVNYTCMRGWFDLAPLTNIYKRRSIYGLKKSAELKTHVRRKLRDLYG